MLSRALVRHQRAASGISSIALKRPSIAPSTHHSAISVIRQAHSLPLIGSHDQDFKENGVPDLFSKGGFDIAWTGYQTSLLERLNNLLAGNVRETWPVQRVAIDTARNPATANTFNYASMAHNNHFFFSTITNKTTEIPEELRRHLERSFSSIETLRATFIATASAMFGPGFVWLVQQRDANPSDPTNSTYGSNTNHQEYGMDFRILTTYLAGSPYPQAHWRQQNKDMNTENAESASQFLLQNTRQNTAGRFGDYSRRPGDMADIAGGGVQDQKRFGGADVIPLMCVSTWEHTWMPDWGINGKGLFLEQWWERIDWEAVQANLVSPTAYRDRPRRA